MCFYGSIHRSMINHFHLYDELKPNHGWLYHTFTWYYWFVNDISKKMQSFRTHPKHLLEMEEKGFSKGLFKMRMKYLYVFLWIDDSRIQSFVVLIAIGNDRIWFEIFRCKLVNTFDYEMAKTHIAINYSIQYIRNMNRFKCTLVDLNDPFEYL